ncbi:ABC transporter permease [Bartonella sp. B10834G6]|uniref:ABC transporter permease n=1 Tax=Bartonella apis TaxID=1686310 RepID=UPI0018DC0D11|nr:ABC transporter permease [Bartonella apis]MBH9981865.1 ABC transporter permease [Bartonella apis]
MRNRFNKKLAFFLHGLVVFFGILALWWGVAIIFDLKKYILPSPLVVAQSLWNGREYLLENSLITIVEIVIGFILGILSGAALALLLMFSKTLQKWLMPVLIVSQSIPVFALAPILVLWFGYGILSKIIAAILVIFFPVTTAFFDGLRRTNVGYLDLARTMGASSLSQLVHIRLVAALPALGSGVRVAAAIAPIGAIIGEWVGSSGGLGYIMLNANARMQTPTCFAAIFILSIIAMILWYITDIILKYVIYWDKKSEQN